MVFKKKVWYTFCRLLIVLCLDKVKGMRTGMENIFITKLTLEKVRNLDYVEIPLAKDKKKHLIFTGKNGSGKTTILNSILM